MEKHEHSNISFLEWQNDETLLGISEDVEDIAQLPSNAIDSISLLIGPHEILSLTDQSITKSDFSFAFYSPDAPQGDIEDIELKAKKDKQLREKIDLLTEITGSSFKVLLGAP